MGTRSNIAIEDGPGKVRQIYCHWDGYPSNNGRILLEHYTTTEKVEALIALGNISSLGPEVAPPSGVPHSFDGPKAPGVTVAYGRGRGETGQEAKVQMPACEQEYLYVWRGPLVVHGEGEEVEGGWWYSDHGSPLEPLCDEDCDRD